MAQPNGQPAQAEPSRHEARPTAADEPRERRRIFQRPRRNAINLLLAVAIGVFTGYGAVLFKFVLKSMQWVFYQNSEEFLYIADTIPAWAKVAMPCAGGVVVGLIVSFFAKEAKGHGVPEVMEAIALRDGRIRKRVAAAKIVASAVTIGSGGSVGREGPMVQIGASIGSTVGQLFKVPTMHMRTMVGCGAAAGIAATFNAPIAGVLFALEIIIGDFGFLSFSPVVLSSVTATAISRYYFGEFPFFILPEYRVATHWEYLMYPFLGVASGLAALAFIRVLTKFEDGFEALPVPEWTKPALGGLLLGLLVLWRPEIFGVGYGAMNLSLGSQLTVGTLFLLIWIKMLASSLTLGSGGSGGIFAPSLFLGAMVGGCFGWLMGWLFPGLTASPGAYALVGMGGMVAGTTYAPITAILIIFELTSNYSIILPLMLTCITATMLNSSLQRASIYTIKLLRRGIDIEAGRERSMLRNMLVRDFMDTELHTIPASAPLERIIWSFKTENAPYLHVVNNHGDLTGIISFRDLRAVLREEALMHLIIAHDIATTRLITVTPSDTLEHALNLLTEHSIAQLPVVGPETGRLLGTLTERAVNAAYNQALIRRELMER